MANARVDQAAILVLGSAAHNARVDQAAILTLGSPTVNARVDQAAILALGSPVVHARIDQSAILTLGPPVVNARVDQSSILTLGPPVPTQVTYTFSGATGNAPAIGPAFYGLTNPGAELVPIPDLLTVVVTGFGITSPSTQTLSVDGTYAYWVPANGPLTICFTNNQPVRSIWFPNPGTYTGVATVWASSEFHTPYKQVTNIV